MWFSDFVTALLPYGYQPVNNMRSAGLTIGWIPQENIRLVRELPQVYSINDDYPFLVQMDPTAYAK